MVGLIAVLALALGPPSAADDEATVSAGPTFGVAAQAFVRGQGRLEPDLDASAGRGDLGQVVERFRGSIDARLRFLRAFVQVQEARTFTFERGAATQDGTFGVHQGFAEVSGRDEGGRRSGMVRAGRQEIAWGRQRLIGPLLWLPGARSFDALRAEGSIGPWTVDAFAAFRASERVVTVPEDAAMPDGPTMQVTTTTASGFGGGRLELSALEAIRGEAMLLFDVSDAHPSSLGEEHGIVDMGGRLWGSLDPGLSWDAEGHGQVGRRNGLNHRAWAWAAAADWQAQWRAAVRPHVGAEMAMASGDACVDTPAVGCGTSTRRDFFNFYPTNHIHYGLVDLVGWSNMRDVEARVGVAMGEWVDIVASAHFFALRQPSGRWLNAGSALVGSGWDPTNVDRQLGEEIDVVATAHLAKPLQLSAGYGAFLPSAAAMRLLGPDPQHFLYLWIVVTLGGPT